MTLKINGKQIKFYLLIAVSILFLGTGYFRFFHKKASPVAPASSMPAVPIVQSVVFQDMVRGPLDNRQIEPHTVRQPVRTTIRNVFTPGKSESRAKFSDGEQMLSGPGSTLKLSGTIVDSGRPIAIINGKFLRTGQWIDGFQVAKITKNGVLLRSESQKLLLKVLSNAENK